MLEQLRHLMMRGCLKCVVVVVVVVVALDMYECFLFINQSSFSPPRWCCWYLSTCPRRSIVDVVVYCCLFFSHCKLLRWAPSNPALISSASVSAGWCRCFQSLLFCLFVCRLLDLTYCWTYL